MLIAALVAAVMVAVQDRGARAAFKNVSDLGACPPPPNPDLLRATDVAKKHASDRPKDRQPLEDGWAAFYRGDYETAYQLWLPLAEKGNPRAQNNVGSLYLTGWGWTVPPDYAEAAKWFRLAAEQDNARGQLRLSDMYESGLGMKKDLVQAYMWLSLAARKRYYARSPDEASAETKRLRMCFQMTPAQLAEAKKLAREWRPK